MIRAAVPTTADLLVRAIGAALDGVGPPVAPGVPGVPGRGVPGRGVPGHGPAAADLPADAALILRTSGSTGVPRDVVLTVGAVLASGVATHARLGGPGHWVLTLPANHVAGVQVIARAHAAGLGLTAADTGPFTADAFAALAARSARRAGGARRYVSLVPTQAHRILVAADGGNPRSLAALADFDAVLIGGAAVPAPLRERLRAAGVRLVVTYGMTETCGGCVYDGVPLDGVQVRIAAGDRDGADAGADAPAGIVEITGPILAVGYLGRPELTAATFRTVDGVRWLHTTDLGFLTTEPTPRLRVVGRADDVVVTGGVKVPPGAVEACLATVPGIGEACVVGVPDDEWGQALVAVVTRSRRPDPAGDPAGDPAAMEIAARALVAATLGRAAAPRSVLLVDDLPRRGPGKVDREAVRRLVIAARADSSAAHE